MSAHSKTLALGIIALAMHCRSRQAGPAPSSAVRESGLLPLTSNVDSHPDGSSSDGSPNDEGPSGCVSDGGSCAGVGPNHEPPPSCRLAGPGLSDCGPNKESCCTSLEVPGGTFYRSYDGVTFTDKSYPATVSTFRLDKYEVTVGRFRQFVKAVVAGWRPAAGSGKHAHLDAGRGVADSCSSGRVESGWDDSWTRNLATQADSWNVRLQCFDSMLEFNSWTADVGPNENLPVNCVDWFEAYAFCIWDGGFLSTEAEWNYAASGGSEQRAYPWSNPPRSNTIDCSLANFDGACHSRDALKAVGSESPNGDGAWGQADLAGNVSEWSLDFYRQKGDIHERSVGPDDPDPLVHALAQMIPEYKTPCIDCACLTPKQEARFLPHGSCNYDCSRSAAFYRVLRGGEADDNVRARLLVSWRTGANPTARESFASADAGVRCARPRVGGHRKP